MKKCPVYLDKSNNDVDTRLQVCDRESNMFFFFRDVCFIFAIAFTTFASLLNSQSKTKKTFSPVPFFWSESVIQDFYKGEMHLLMREVARNHHAFIMLYAPWDADSRDARAIFDEVARFYENEVYFASVNCWQPGSPCRSTFKNIPKFPQMVAYLGPHEAVEYRGPLETNHIIKFIHSILHPISRVNTKSEIWEMRFRHDALLVGCLKMHGLKSSKGYNLLYMLARKMTGRDYVRKIGFAVLTHDKINHVLNVTKTPSFVLYLWNREIVYSGPMKLDSMIKWLLKETIKSELFKDQMPNVEGALNPTVVALFYQPQPLVQYDYYRYMIRKVGLKFYGCSNFFNKSSDSEFFNHLLNGTDVYSLYEEGILMKVQKRKNECVKRALHTNARTCPIENVWTNTSCKPQSCPSTFLSKTDDKRKQSFVEWSRQLDCDLLERGMADFHSSVSAVNWQAAQGKNNSWNNSTYYVNACNAQSAVFFSLVDIERHQHLTNSLGIEYKAPLILLINSQEMMMVEGLLTEPRVGQVLQEFIQGRINGRRHYRHGNPNMSLKSVKSHSPVAQNSISLTEITSDTFEKIVFNETKNVIVLYYSKECGSCGMVSMVMLRLAQSLQPLLNNYITFARINGDNNDLPFHLHVATYPTVIIFPAKRKAESHVFPYRRPWTLLNLTKFMFASLEPRIRVIAMLASCSKWSNKPMSSTEGETCIKEARIETIELIAENLRRWRTEPVTAFQNRRRALETLAFLKQAYLRLASVPDLTVTLEHLLQAY